MNKYKLDSARQKNKDEECERMFCQVRRSTSEQRARERRKQTSEPRERESTGNARAVRTQRY